MEFYILNKKINEVHCRNTSKIRKFINNSYKKYYKLSSMRVYVNKYIRILLKIIISSLRAYSLSKIKKKRLELS